MSIQKWDVQESTIRKMTRLAHQYNAVNLSQGFPNEGPPFEAVVKATSALIGGQPGRLDVLDTKISDLCDGQDLNNVSVVDLLAKLYTPEKDELNQYSIPYGVAALREAVAKYYQRFYQWDINPETQITVCCGATEAFSATIRALFGPGDKLLILEPFHELYPQQAKVFYLETEFTALYEKDGKWEIDWKDLEEQAKKCKAFLLNSPHNPTGKVFTFEELQQIVTLCLKHDLYLITDEIYEFMIYNSVPHFCIPKTFPEIKDRCIVISSVSKTFSASGWRVGWAITPEPVTKRLQGVHDQMVLQATTPMQVGVQAFLSLPDRFFREEVPQKYLARRNLFIPALRDIGFDVITPDAAYYAFCNYRNVPQIKHMTPMEAAMYLVEKVKVACVPGDGFYFRHQADHGQNYIRFCFVRHEVELEKAIELLQVLKQ